MSRVDGLGAGDVHLWRIWLNEVSNLTLRRLRETLNGEELGRAERFRFAVLQHRFVAARGALRSILARYLSVEPGRLRFAYGAHGKPFLADANEEISFNLSHSDDLMVVAVSRDGPVGVDIERQNPRFHILEIADRFFCEREKKHLAGLDAAVRLEAFFQIWTAKEAVLKAAARGLALELTKVEVALSPLRVVALDETEKIQDESWRLIALRPAEQYCGTLAVAALPSQVEWRDLAL